MKRTDGLGKSHETGIDLTANQLVTIEGQAGMSIHCLYGQVWITQEGDWRDYIVPRGLRFVAPGAGRIVVNGAAEHSRIEVDRTACTQWGIGPRQPLHID